MEAIKRILVAVDLTEMDETLIRYITRLSNEITLDKVYFLNVMKSLEIPEKIIKKYPNLMAPMDETTKKDIQFTIDQEAGNQLKTDYEIKVIDGNRAENILKWAKVKEVDLIVLGRKTGLEGEGIVSSKVVKLAPCSVVLIPEMLPENLNKLVLPIDFSSASKIAFEHALLMAKTIQGLKITCLNVYDVPSGYHVSGKSYEEFAEIMKQNALESFNEFISEYDKGEVDIDIKFVLNEDRNVAKSVYQFAVKERASAIVMGSKGRTQAAAVLIGSIAEKLIKINALLPVYVIKQRRHNMDFLEALLKI